MMDRLSSKWDPRSPANDNDLINWAINMDRVDDKNTRTFNPNARVNTLEDD
jgi:hypothetical protein